jgi:uncharacterized protein
VTQAPSPIARQDRVVLIDILGGLCILAILLVNFTGSTGTLFPTLDDEVSWWFDLLIQNSNFPVFAFLFGYWFAMQMERASTQNSAVMIVFLRRMLALVLIGLFHLVLIWRGDILLDYALLGIILIPFRWVPTRALLLVILLLLARDVFSYPLPDNVQRWTSASTANQGSAILAQEVRNDHGRQINLRTMRARDKAGSWREALDDRAYEAAVNLRDLTTGLGGILRKLSEHIFIMFLLGMYAGRRGWLQDASKYRKQFLIATAVALLLVVAGNISYYHEPSSAPLRRALGWWCANISLGAFYLCIVAFAVTSGGTLAKRLRIFAPVGMTALSNYVAQSVVMTFVFQPYGLGVANPSTTGWLLLNIAFFFLVQVPLSHWWVARFRYGPLEWVWRSLAYGSWQPMRRVPAPMLPQAA